MAVHNPFSNPVAGRLYSRGRPDYHPALVPLLREHLGFDRPLGLALDVGCGTGQSSSAIRSLARTVLGVDPSASMLAQAPRLEGLCYARASAEALPVRDAAVGLLVCGAAFHWFDRDAFFREVRRVLRPDGAMVLYDNFFNPEPGEFLSWHRGSFIPRFPRPSRNPDFDARVGEAAGFRVRGPEKLGVEVSMSLDDLANYLLTQSNVLSAPDPPSESEAWLRKELARFFESAPRRPFSFVGPVWILTRRDEPDGIALPGRG